MQEIDVRVDIGRRLRRWLTFKGWSIRDLADRSHIPYRTLQNYLNGTRAAGVKHLAGISNAGVDLNWLLTGEIKGALGPDLDALGSAEASLVNADLELMTALHQKAVEHVDILQRQRAEAGEPLMPATQALAVAVRFTVVLVEIAQHMADQIADLRRHQVPMETLVDVIAGGLKARADEIAAGVETPLTNEIRGALSPLLARPEGGKGLR